jgi:DNA-binding FadR family transcriptional regulator
MTTEPMTTQPMPKFDPKYVAALREVLDIAVGQIAVQHRTPATKAKMAETIVRNAADGVTDAQDLVWHAVQAGADGAP